MVIVPCAHTPSPPPPPPPSDFLSFCLPHSFLCSHALTFPIFFAAAKQFAERAEEVEKRQVLGVRNVIADYEERLQI